MEGDQKLPASKRELKQQASATDEEAHLIAPLELEIDPTGQLFHPSFSRNSFEM